MFRSSADYSSQTHALSNNIFTELCIWLVCVDAVFIFMAGGQCVVQSDVLYQRACGCKTSHNIIIVFC